jgi:hypothetical protein
MPKGTGKRKKWDEPTERIQAYLPQSHKAEMKIKLHYHGASMAPFLRAIVKAFVQEDALFMAWFDEWKLRNSKIKGKGKHRKSSRLKEAGEELSSQFGINEGDIEDIFDVIAKEHPEL